MMRGVVEYPLMYQDFMGGLGGVGGKANSGWLGGDPKK